MNHYDKFVDYIYKLSQIDLDYYKLGNQVYNCIIDYTSAIIGGTGLSRSKISTLLDNCLECGIYKTVGFDEKVPLETALLANGLLSHVAELDDGVIDGIIHPGAPIFTSIFTVFQNNKIEWKLFVKAVVVGYEVACRIAEAIQPGHKLLGYHASATCGTLGVTMALATLSNFDKSQMKEALTIALASSHGTLKVLEDRSELKPYNIASAIINGYIAYQMAKAGFRGADNPFEGEAGFFSQMARDVDYDKLINNNRDLCIFRTYFKPYASCRYTHPSLEAAMKIKNLYNIDVDQIESVLISTYSIAIRHHDHTEVPNLSSAKMCIPFAASVGLSIGSGGIDAFCDETINDPRIKELTRKVRVIEDTKYSSLFPGQSIANMSVKTKDGISFSCTIDLPKGEPNNPMTQSDLFSKLKQSCEFSNFNFDNICNYIKNLQLNGIEDFFGNLNRFYFHK